MSTTRRFLAYASAALSVALLTGCMSQDAGDEEVIKGKATAGDTIEVNQMGGTFEGVRYVENGTTMLKPGSDDNLLFLRDNGGNRPFGLLNPDQSVYTVEADGSLRPVGETHTRTDVTDIRGVKATVTRAK